MKTLPILLYLSLAINVCLAQQLPIDIDGLEGGHKDAFTRIGPPAIFFAKKGLLKYKTPQEITSTAFVITYTSEIATNFPEAAKPAFQYACDIWASLISTNVTIQIKANYKSLGSTGPLANTSPDQVKDFTGAPTTGIYYPTALAEKLSGQNLNNTTSDIVVNMNSDIPEVQRYYDLDGYPVSGKYDYVSIFLHEIAHGLGIASTFGVNGSGSGSWGILSGSEKYPNIYDKAIVQYENSHNNASFKLTNTDSYVNPSTELGNVLKGNNVFFDGDAAYDFYVAAPFAGYLQLPKLYAPSTWSSGSSISHLDEDQYPAGTSNSLMSKKLDFAEAIHSPGELASAMLQDLGWTLNRVATITSPGGTSPTVWATNSTHNILYTDNQAGSVVINLMKRNSAGNFVFDRFIDNNTDVKGPNSYSWSISSTIPDGNYYIQITTPAPDLAPMGMSNVFGISGTGLQIAAPVFDLPEGPYHPPQSVHISCTTQATGLQIRYTVNGSNPDATSLLYDNANPVSITATTTLKAIGIAPQYLTSPVTTAVYTITPDIIIAQLDENSTSFGSVGGYNPLTSRWDMYGSPWVNPSDPHLGYTELLSSQDFKPGTTQKFQRWIRTLLQGAPQTSYLNWGSLSLANSARFESHFKTAYNASFTIQNVDGISFTGGTFDFKDPWYNDDNSDAQRGVRNRGVNATWLPKASGFSPNTSTSGPGSEYKGVFLNETPDPLNAQIPYYSVRAPANQSLTVNSQAVPACFVNWVADPASASLVTIGTSPPWQKAVVFKSNGAVVTTNYKLHMMSNVPAAIGTNSQGKLVKLSGAGFLRYLAYESNNGCYFTSSPDGNNWSNETPILTLPSTYTYIKYPTMVLDPYGDRFEVLYDVVNPTTNNHWINMDMCDFANNLQPMQGFVQVQLNTPAPPTYNPHVSAAWGKNTAGHFNSAFAMVWIDGSSSNMGIGGYNDGPGQQPPYQFHIVYLNLNSQLSMASNVSNIVVAMDDHPGNQYYQVYLAWEEPGTSGGIKFAVGSINSNTGQYSMGPTVVTIASNSSTDVNKNPTLAVDGFGNAFIAWEFNNGTQGNIKIQRRYGTNPIFTFPNCSGAANFPSSPSLTDFRFTSAQIADIAMVYYRNGGMNPGTYYAYFNGTSLTWSSEALVDASGRQASLSSNSSAGDASRDIVYVKSNGAPYAITVTPAPTSFPSQLPPQLVSPAINATNVPLAVQLNWASAQGACSYSVQVAYDQSFSTLFDFQSTTGNSCLVSGLSTSTPYYWRVGATPTTGTTLWSSGRQFVTKSGGSGGCPFVFTSDGGNLKGENNILPQSEYPGNEGKKVTDYYKLISPPLIQNDEYVLEIREFEAENSYLDQFKLIAIDHPADTKIAVLPDGRIVQYVTPYQLRQVNKDAPQILEDFDHQGLELNRGERVSLTFTSDPAKFIPSSLRPNYGGLILGGWARQRLSTDQCCKQQKMGVVTAPELGFKSGGASFTFRERPDLVYVPLESIKNDLSLQFNEDVELDYANLAIEVTSSIAEEELPLSEAVHSRLRNVSGDLGEVDDRTATLSPGESITLRFRVMSPTPAGEIRDFLLVSVGRYEHLKSEKKEIPTEYKLSQNYPNPFNPLTIISYQLPMSGFVNLRIFNILGQEVRTLVDGIEEAGYKSVQFDGSGLPSGVYYYRLQAAEFVDVKKMVVTK